MHFIFQGQQRLFSFYVSAGAVSATVHRKLSKVCVALKVGLHCFIMRCALFGSPLHKASVLVLSMEVTDDAMVGGSGCLQKAKESEILCLTPPKLDRYQACGGHVPHTYRMPNVQTLG